MHFSVFHGNLSEAQLELLVEVGQTGKATEVADGFDRSVREYQFIGGIFDADVIHEFGQRFMENFLDDAVHVIRISFT